MNAAPQAHVCPLLVNKQRLGEDDRRCHIPAIRIRFLDANPDNKACHDGDCCLASKYFPEKAHQEVSIRNDLERRREKNRRRTLTRKLIEKAKGNTQDDNRSSTTP